MTNSQSIINFMYFANNFSQPLLKGMFEVTNAPQHLENKFTSLAIDNGNNGTKALFQWFMQLSTDNQMEVSNFITINYECGIDLRQPAHTVECMCMYCL
jgi:hypothetical protein